MELESNPLLKRSVSQRLLSAMMMIALVLACLAGITWFIRAFDLPPTIAVPSSAGSDCGASRAVAGSGPAFRC